MTSRSIGFSQLCCILLCCIRRVARGFSPLSHPTIDTLRLEFEKILIRFQKAFSQSGYPLTHSSFVKNYPLAECQTIIPKEVSLFRPVGYLVKMLPKVNQNDEARRCKKPLKEALSLLYSRATRASKLERFGTRKLVRDAVLME
jgi:hypothetical protein